MKYILNEQYILRGWQRLPYGVMNNGTKEVQFVKKEFFDFLLKCDGRMEIPEIQNPELKKYVGKHLEDGVIRPARRTDFLSTEQLFVQYPCRYKHDVQWSVTGRCNLRCKHCFMSAPTGKHGNPSYEELLNVADQLAECRVFSVGLTGGEPLVRKDFWQIVEALTERKIVINAIYSNGLLVNEEFVREFKKRKLLPACR